MILELAAVVPQILPYGFTVAILKLAWMIPEKRKTWLEGTGQRIQNEILGKDKELQQLEIDARKLDIAARAAIQERVREAFPESAIADDELSRSVEEFVLPPLKALGRSGVTDLATPTELGEDSPQAEDPA